MGNIVKPNGSKGSDILLTPGSSRRKTLWKRLQNSKPAKGLTQDQVNCYLQTFMKQHYQKVRKEGALTSDKVQNYLDYLAKLAANSLSKVSMDQSNVVGYSERVRPVIEDVGTKSSITEEDVERHSNEIRNQAQIHIRQMTQAVGENKMAKPENKKEPDKSNSQLQSSDKSESDQQPASAGQDSKEESEGPSQQDLLSQNIVPIGFEEGAPQVSLKTFFSFPLSAKEAAPESDKRYDMHFKYLDLAVKESFLKNETLAAAREMLGDLPQKRYSKYFDIFPENEYDDSQLMIIFSQWRNQTLNRLLIENEDES